MNKAISISLAKIDYDLGQPYIKIIADNPHGYQFTQCIIEVHPIIDGNWGEVKRFDVSSLLEGREDINMSLPVSALEGASSPAIYDIYLKVVLIHIFFSLNNSIHISFVVIIKFKLIIFSLFN